MIPDTLASQLQALIGPEEEWPDEVRRLVEHDDNYYLTQPCYWRAALLGLARMVAFEHERAEAYRELTKEPQP